MSTSNIINYSHEFAIRRNLDIKKYKNLLPIEKSEYKKIFDIQTKYEDQLLTESRICHPSGNNSLLNISIIDVSGINRDSILYNLKTKFYDYSLMEEIRCLINTIIDIENGDGISERKRIQHFMETLKRFGSPSAYNFALKGELTTDSNNKNYHKITGDMFVIKCPREPINAKELIHELVCGTKALNNLRQYIPNFSYVYDAFYCDAPIVNDSTKDVISWCINSENPVSYVVYEAVQNPSAFGDIAKNKKAGISKKFLMYMGQTTCAEYLAELLYNFAHCDAHSNNVLISEYKHETEDYSPLFYIPYSFNGEVYYVPSPGGIVMFIDYGMSRVVIKEDKNSEDVCLGKLDSSGFFSNIGISPFDAMAIADIHKLLSFILKNSVIEENQELIKCVSGLLCGYFYNNETPSEDEYINLLEIQWEGRYHVQPDLVREKGWNMVDFIVYLNRYCNKYDVNLLNKYEELPKGVKIFGELMEDDITTVKEKMIEIKEELQIFPSKIPSLFDLSQNPSNLELKDLIIANSKIIIDTETSSIHSIMSDISHPFFVINSDISKIDESLDVFITSIQDIAEILSNCNKLKEKLLELRIAQNIINLLDLSTLISEVDKMLKSNVIYIKRIKNAIYDNYNTLQKFIFGKERTTNLTEDEISEYSENKYFNLYDKYNKVISIIENI